MGVLNLYTMVYFKKQSKYNSSGYDKEHPRETNHKESIINFALFTTMTITAILIVYGFKTNHWALLQGSIAFVVAFWCWRIFISLTNAVTVFMAEAILALLMLAIIVFCAIYEVQYLFFNY